jgi:hypothetical protein
MNTKYVNGKIIAKQETALTICLALALIAETDFESEMQSLLADYIANGLDSETVERCKSNALTIAFGENQEAA